MLTLDDRQRHERMLIEEALARRPGGYVDRAVRPEEAIDRFLGDELIDASRETVGAYYMCDDRRLDRAIRWLARLVGGAP